MSRLWAENAVWDIILVLIDTVVAAVLEALQYHGLSRRGGCGRVDVEGRVRVALDVRGLDGGCELCRH